MEVINLLFKNPIVIITLIVILITKLFPPKNINSLYGYRTVNSMKNKINWDFAQKYSTNLFLVLLSFLLLIQIILYIIYGTTSYIDLSVFAGLMLCIVIVLYQTERKLKLHQFKDN
ncbi:SdpI family protein [Flavobacterium johnsoniae]|uniref:SdpI/YhfL protein family protein n=1 Tax=Flavobacterium johnsoniae TaxID=986 RepID=A0A1M5TBE1_FLAJO|nr:SdpI family protein [Flavobacterium johnsoniae]SHH48039.1 SdpI/YhfL protein family protein [Flavobacterium johnsoniae]